MVNNLITNHSCYYYSTTNITSGFVYLAHFSGVTPGPQEKLLAIAIGSHLIDPLLLPTTTSKYWRK